MVAIWPGAALRLMGVLDDDDGIAVVPGLGVGTSVKTEGTPGSLDGALIGNCVNVVGRMVVLLGATELLPGTIVKLATGLGAVVIVMFGFGA